jgi:phosphohistidine swiveling domain-containing protein
MNSKRWKKLWSRDFGVQFMYMPAWGFKNGFTSPSGFQLHPITESLFLPEQNMQSMFVLAEELDQFLKDIDDCYLSQPENLRDFIQEFPKNGELFVTRTAALSGDKEEASNEELKERLSRFNTEFAAYGIYLWITFYLNELMGERVGKMVNGLSISEEEKTALVDYATTPSRPAGVLLLAQESTRGKSIAELTKEFAWLSTLDVHTTPATEEDIKERLIHSEVQEAKKPRILETLPQDAQHMIEFSRDTTYMKDLRDDFRRRGISAALPLFDEIGVRIGLARQHLSYLTTEEIAGLLSDQSGVETMRKKAEKRKSLGYFLHFCGDEIHVAEEPEIVRELSIREGIDLESVPEDSSEELRGVTGCKGKVTGKVTVVKGIGETGKMQQGDVLCTVTTNPDYLPAMHKAVAIITDEGGITCHAAIVARELKKPCIVGLQKGTKVLRDGDMVEVDADNGVVKIISRA